MYPFLGVESMKKVLALVLLIVVAAGSAFAVTHLSVPLGDRVYEILHTAELRGIINQLGTVKPYPRSIVVANLERILQSSEITSAERVEILQILDRFDASFTSPETVKEALTLGGYQSYWDQYKTGVVFGVETGLTVTHSIIERGAYDVRVRLRPYMRGDISDFLSFQMDFGLVLDRLDASLFPFNDFTFESDGKYDSIFNVTEQHGFYYGQFNEPELALQFLDGNVQIRWGATYRDWGVAYNNLMIAGSARPFQGIETSIKFTPWLNYQFITGTLGKFSQSSYITAPERNREFFEDYFFADGQQGLEYLNNFSAHRFELNLPWGISLGIYESVVYRQRFEFGYLNPLSILMFEQINVGDFDNMFAGVDAQVLIPGFGRLYAALATTEMDDIHLNRLFKEPRNIMAFQAGVDIPIKLGNFAKLTLQYTYLGPFFYTHYPVDLETGNVVDQDGNQVYAQKLDEGKELVDDTTNPLKTQEVWHLSYVNKGRPLGYPLQPNSDEILLRGTVGLSGGWELEGLVKYQRRSGQYGATMNENMIYRLQRDGKYEDKAFNANVFEQLISLELGGTKRFENLPFALTGKYLFHAQWSRDRQKPSEGDVNYTVTGPWKFDDQSHAIQLGVKVWY